MNILVFGASGQVATELARATPVTCLSRRDADLSNPEACRNAIKDRHPDAVINAAAYTAVDKAESEPELAHLVNAEAPGQMALACSALEIPLVHISTDYVFAGTGSTPWREEDPISPLGVYGDTKAKGEAMVRESGCTHAILRTSWVFSAHGANFVKTMLRLAEDRSELRIVEDQIGGPTDARSIARACLDLARGLRAAPEKSGTYHFSGAPDASWAELATDIFAQTGKLVSVEGIPTSEFPTPAKRPANSRLDCSAIESKFGIKRPRWKASLAEVLRELGATE